MQSGVQRLNITGSQRKRRLQPGQPASAPERDRLAGLKRIIALTCPEAAELALLPGVLIAHLIDVGRNSDTMIPKHQIDFAV